MPKVSLIIPVYNITKYLRKCLDSIVDQTLKDLEIICINDGSTDDSPFILEKYAKKDSRFIIINQENKGVGIARNTGLEIASGEYIMFVDPDDWLLPYACEKAYNQIKKNSNDFVIFGHKRYIDIKNTYESGSWRIEPYEKYINNQNIVLKNTEMNIFKTVVSWSQIYSRNFLNKYNIRFSEYKSLEDLIFYFKAHIYANNISVLPEDIYIYRVRNSSLSNDGLNIYYEDHFKSKYACLKFIDESNIDEHFKNSFYIYSINSYIYWYQKICKDNPMIQNKFYKQMKEFFILLNNNYNIEKIKNYINYKKYLHICKTPCWIHHIENFMQNIFCINSSNDKSHKIIKILWLKISIKSKK